VSRRSRTWVDRAMRVACLLLAAAAALPLVLIVLQVWSIGHGALSWHLLSHPREQALTIDAQGAHIHQVGGVWNAIVGSLMVVGLSTAFSAPIGILAGVWLSESGSGRVAAAVRGAAEAMAGVPSIVAGIFGYALVVRGLGLGYSGWAAAAALSIVMLPTVTRATEEGLRTVPRALREGALALGAPRWLTTLRIVLPNAWGAVMTGLLLAMARAAGETAPVLLTSLANRLPPSGPGDKVSTLPTVIYDYINDPSAELHAQAQGAALLLIGGVLAVNVAVRLMSARRSPRSPRASRSL
jgi:phosphate transport system permease protein